MPSIDVKVKKLLFQIACTYKYLTRMALCAELEALVKEHQPDRYGAISLVLQGHHERYLNKFPYIASHLTESYREAKINFVKILTELETYPKDSFQGRCLSHLKLTANSARERSSA